MTRRTCPPPATPDTGRAPTAVTSARQRKVGELLSRMSALDHVGEGPRVSIARRSLREQAAAMGMAIVSVSITQEAIPDPAIEALPRREHDRIAAITRLMYTSPGQQLAELERLAARYPHIPMLRNHLAGALEAAGQRERAGAVMAALAAEFPTYVFGVCNHVMFLLQDGKVDAARAIVETGPRGPLFTLPAFDPARDTFHVSEAAAHSAMVGHYMFCTGRLEAAEVQLKMLRSVAPDSPQAESLANAIERRETLGWLADAIKQLIADGEQRAARKAAKTKASEADSKAGKPKRQRSEIARAAEKPRPGPPPSTIEAKPARAPDGAPQEPGLFGG